MAVVAASRTLVDSDAMSSTISTMYGAESATPTPCPTKESPRNKGESSSQQYFPPILVDQECFLRSEIFPQMSCFDCMLRDSPGRHLNSFIETGTHG